MGETEENAPSSAEVLDPYIAPLAALLRLLSRYEGRGIIIGGIAASLLGKPRRTVDIDAILLLSIDQIPQLLQNATEEGILPRIENAGEFARRNRVLLLRHPMSDTPIDLSLGILPFEEEAVQRGRLHNVGSLEIPLPTVEDLIIMKAVAHRPKDFLDIEALLQIHPNFDRKRIEFWVRQFAEALEMPEIWTTLQKTLSPGVDK